jgi:Family of unknown function (DUF6152)
MKSTIVAAGMALAVVTGVIPVAAHHSFAMFDSNRRTTWTGTVEEFRWVNPHTFIIINVPRTREHPELAGRWAIEGGSPNIMSRQGWRRNLFRPGDQITIVGYPLRDGSKGGSLFYAIGPDGNRLYHDVNRDGGPAGGGRGG